MSDPQDSESDERFFKIQITDFFIDAFAGMLRSFAATATTVTPSLEKESCYSILTTSRSSRPS